ncbi:MAG: hypothetical protein ABIK68_21645 [bacterium]
MNKDGFILPFSIILALVVLTSLGLWYRQVILQSFLADRLLLLRGQYIECRSLIPVLTEKLNQLEMQRLSLPEDRFLMAEVDHQIRWQVDRSAWVDDRIRFAFKRVGRDEEPLLLIVPYHRKETSGVPPAFSTEGGSVLKTGPADR